MSLIAWSMRIDRRQAQRTPIIDELTSLCAAIEGVRLHIIPEADYLNATDGGAFRDFIPAATLSSTSTQTLEYIAELMLDAHRWHVDFAPMPSESISIATMTLDDLDDVYALQQLAYTDLVETRAALHDKLRHGPTLCHVARDEHGHLMAYLLAHPWPSHLPPPAWDTPLDALPQPLDALYLHDLAMHPDARGKNLGTRMAHACLDAARALQLSCALLVAVQASQPFWRRIGFLDAPEDPALQEKLATYGHDATLMRRAL